MPERFERRGGAIVGKRVQCNIDVPVMLQVSGAIGRSPQDSDTFRWNTIILKGFSCIQQIGRCS